jgi:hypothetical protein
MTYKPDEDEKGAVEQDVDRSKAVVGDEVLGYSGSAREEHSGEENPPAAPADPGAAKKNQ